FLETDQGKSSVPKDNEVYAEPSFFDKSGLKTGDTIVIGFSSYKVSKVIKKEPDQFGSTFSFAPKVLMSLNGWKNTGIDNFSSRISYSVSIKFDKELSEDNYQKIEKELKFHGLQVTNSKKGPSQLVSIVDAWQKFFLTVTILTLFLIMVNIRINLAYLTNYFTKTIAIFKVLGMKRFDIASIFFFLILTISLLSSMLGTITGNLLGLISVPYLEGIVQAKLIYSGLFSNIGIITIFITSICFFASVKSFLNLINIEPKILISQPITAKNRLNSFLSELITNLLVVLGLFSAIYYFTNNIKLSLISISIVFFVFVFFIGLVKTIIWSIYKSRFKLGFSIRTIINFVKNQGITGETAIASLTLALSAIFIIASVQINIKNNLEGPLKGKFPNLYVIDIQQNQKDEVSKIINDIKLFPNVKARMIKIDDLNVQDSENKLLDQELKREFNLTYRTNLIEGERVLQGTFHNNDSLNEVSVEKSFADRVGIKMDSILEFLIQGIPIKAKVTSLRSINRTQGLPFFYFVFSPDVLKEAPQSFLGYTRISEDEIPKVQSKLIKKFPNIFTIPMSDVLKTIQSVTDVVINAVLAVSFPSLVLGIILIFSMLLNSANERFRELLLLKILGAEEKQVFRLYIYETSFFIMFSLLFSLIFSFGLSYFIIKYLFKFETFTQDYRGVFIVIGIFLTNSIFTFYLLKNNYTKKPSDILREQN
ncbi:MAG: ABC transporter permease, partial [Candidatus Sericytochromatia bacterium]